MKVVLDKVFLLKEAACVPPFQCPSAVLLSMHVSPVTAA